jgi:hypothetical protein
LEDGSWVEDKEQTLKIKASYVISAFGSTLSDNEGGWCGRKETFLKFARNLRRQMCRTIHIFGNIFSSFSLFGIMDKFRKCSDQTFYNDFLLARKRADSLLLSS